MKIDKLCTVKFEGKKSGMYMNVYDIHDLRIMSLCLDTFKSVSFNAVENITIKNINKRKFLIDISTETAYINTNFGGNLRKVGEKDGNVTYTFNLQENRDTEMDLMRSANVEYRPDWDDEVYTDSIEMLESWNMLTDNEKLKRIFHNEIRYTVVNTDEDSVLEYKKLPLFQKTVRDLIQRLYDRPISNGIAGVSKKDVIEICIENLKKD